MDEFHQTYLLSMLANTASSLINQTKAPGSASVQKQAELLIEAELSIHLCTALQALNINASIAWGPAVYVDPEMITINSNGTYNAMASNVCVVFKSDNIYTVAIVGAMANSLFDEIGKDAYCDWRYGHVPACLEPKISKRIDAGLNILLYYLKDKGSSITDYFKRLKEERITVTFTGFGLGSDLAAALGLALFGKGTRIAPALSKKQKWRKKVCALTDPNRVNRDFAAYLGQTFDLSLLPKNETTLDHCWSEQFAKQITRTYHPDWDLPVYANKIVETLLNNIRFYNPFQLYYSDGASK